MDVRVLALACLTFRKIMIDRTGWCPFTQANTNASLTLFLMRANFLDVKEFVYIPESKDSLHIPPSGKPLW